MSKYIEMLILGLKFPDSLGRDPVGVYGGAIR